VHPRIDTLLLLAPPASGKSELRRYLGWLDAEAAAADLGLGPAVQLDDDPYLHLMRRIDEELRHLDAGPVFFASNEQPMLEGHDWATLIELINEDYAALGSTPAVPAAPTAWLFERFDRARRSAGVPPPFDDLPEDLVEAAAVGLDGEIAGYAGDRSAHLASYEPGVSTVVIAFARGGPTGTTPPLTAPHGYAFSLSFLSADILRRACALYVWVTPEESRRRNRERAHPVRGGGTSILHHGMPEVVMHEEYGMDDFHWLLERGGGDTIEVELDDATYVLPAAVFDNRDDHTTFLRADPGDWDEARVAALHAELVMAFADLQ
jgi:hypothetical protein